MADKEKKTPATKKPKEIKMIIGYDAKGKAIRKSFYDPTSKKRAREKGQEYIDKLNKGMMVDENITFEQWSLTWLDTYVTGVSETTRKDTYENTVKNHLNPYFEGYKLHAIKPVDIQKFFNSKAKMSFSLLHKCDFILRAIFEQAADNEILYKSPYRISRFPPERPPGRERYTPKNRSEFISISARRMSSVCLPPYPLKPLSVEVKLLPS